MGFGPRFELPHTVNEQEVTVVMRPAEASDTVPLTRLSEFAVQQFLGRQGGVTIRDEEEWIERTRASSDIRWMIALREGENERLVGTTGLHRLPGYRFSSGFLLFDRSVWRQGIASLTHQLRTWYAFCEEGAHVIESSYIEDNEGSGRALRKMGYVETGRKWRSHLSDGRWRDEVLLACYSPLTLVLLWPDGDVPPEVTAAVLKTEAALQAARRIVQPR